MTYTPTAAQPGFIAGFSATYQIISDDAAPEPATISLMALAMASIAAKRWRDNKHAR